MVKVNIKDPRATSMASYLTRCSSVSIVNFGHWIASLDILTSRRSTIPGGVFGAGWGDPVVLGGRGTGEGLDIHFCVIFDCYCQSQICWGEAGRWALSPPNS